MLTSRADEAVVSSSIRWGGDPSQGPRYAVHRSPPRGNADRLRSSAPCSVVGCVRGARVAVLRVRAALGPAAAPGDRAGSGVDARRGHHDPVAIGRRRCDGCGPGAGRSSSSLGIRCWPGRGSSTCRRSRPRCCGLRDQGRAGGRTRRRDREWDDSSAVGSANSCRMRFANWFSTISGCAMRSAGPVRLLMTLALVVRQ
jgi:hypothetical protein